MVGLSAYNSLASEAIRRQHELATRNAIHQDRAALAKILQNEATYVLGLPKLLVADADEIAADRLRGDALLTEAIQLCRALAAELPDNIDYKNRLADLLKLQAQHFGKKDTEHSAQAATAEHPK